MSTKTWKHSYTQAYNLIIIFAEQFLTKYLMSEPRYVCLDVMKEDFINEIRTFIRNKKTNHYTYDDLITLQ